MDSLLKDDAIPMFESLERCGDEAYRQWQARLRLVAVSWLWLHQFVHLMEMTPPRVRKRSRLLVVHHARKKARFRPVMTISTHLHRREEHQSDPSPCVCLFNIPSVHMPTRYHAVAAIPTIRTLTLERREYIIQSLVGESMHTDKTRVDPHRISERVFRNDVYRIFKNAQLIVHQCHRIVVRPELRTLFCQLSVEPNAQTINGVETSPPILIVWVHLTQTHHALHHIPGFL